MEPNIYYNPEKFGLAIVDNFETGGSYEFDTTLVFKNEAGEYFYIHDCGCSCPTPFEGYEVKDLNKLNEDTLYNFEQHIYNQGGDVNQLERKKFIEQISRLVRGI